MIELTVDDYMTRFGEAIDDEQLTGSADGERFSRARVLAQINFARRGLQREFLRAGAVKSRFEERVAISADATDTQKYALPSRMLHLAGIVDGEDREYHPVRSRHRVGERGYLHERRSIRWFPSQSLPPSIQLYALVVREPVTLSLGTAAAGSATSLTFATSPTVGRNVETDDHYNGVGVAILSGTGALQESVITDFDGGTLAATSAWDVAPDATSVYSLMEDMPRCVFDAVVMRAVYNITRFDREYAAVMQQLGGEMQHAYDSALAELLKPTSASADSPRKVENWVV